MVDENVKEYIDYKGDVIRVDWGSKSEKGCLELLLILWLPIAIMTMEVIRG